MLWTGSNRAALEKIVNWLQTTKRLQVSRHLAALEDLFDPEMNYYPDKDRD